MSRQLLVTFFGRTCDVIVNVLGVDLGEDKEENF